jgi:hypothetical protein
MPVIPYGTRHTVEMKVTRWVPRHCELCGQQFAYAAVVKGEGEATSLLWINQAGAKEGAQARGFESRCPPGPCGWLAGVSGPEDGTGIHAPAHPIGTP